jgi:hypothetical protein
MEIREEAIFGGVSFVSSYRCEKCDKSVDGRSPVGHGGTMGTKVVLYPPHFAVGETGDGRRYTKQVLDRKTGELQIEYVD